MKSIFFTIPVKLYIIDPVTYWHLRISTYCILHFMYAYLSRLAYYVNLDSTHIHAMCMNKQNKLLRQQTTWWQRFTRIISRVESREASRSELWQQQRLLRRHR